jgi:hypothetical protein
VSEGAGSEVEGNKSDSKESIWEEQEHRDARITKLGSMGHPTPDTKNTKHI